jgi:hypothetical protein
VCSVKLEVDLSRFGGMAADWFQHKHKAISQGYIAEPNGNKVL